MMISHIQDLCALFAASAKDREAFELVSNIAADQKKWKEAHRVFDEIRRRSLQAGAEGNEEEYQFLESCMKGVWNIGRFPAPFDPESSYKIAPRALRLAAARGIPDEKITTILRS